MIGALISLLSLEMTRRLVGDGVIAATLTVIGASNTTPIVLQTSAPHGFIRSAHGVVDGVGGNDGANGVWVLTPTDTTHLVLTSFEDDGTPVNSAGTGTYTMGGTIQTAFPDGAILLGARNVAMQTAVAAPRIVFVPIGCGSWGLAPYGGVIPTGSIPRALANETTEQQYMKLNRQLATEPHRFEVHVTGCADPPDPDFGDFDVTQALAHKLYAVMFDKISPDRAKVLSGAWSSQKMDVAQLDSRGQKWIGLVEIQQPVTDTPLTFMSGSTTGDFTVNLAGGTTGDEVLIVVP